MAGHASCMEKKINSYWLSVGHLEKIQNFEDKA